MIIKMGQSSSHSTGLKSGRRRSLRSPFLRRSKRNASSLSHSFNISTINENVELLNINSASEEQLMTLPGVSRQIAQAIVDHRQAIGHFRRVDDIALVSGMGADKLKLIKDEICVSRKVKSDSSSRTQSLDSICSAESPRVQLNINTANIFQLQCIPGLNQELAANIVDYRMRKGPFKSLDDLIRVKGMNAVRLGTIKSQLNLIPLESFEVLQIPSNGIDYLNNNSDGHRKLQLSEVDGSINGLRKYPAAPRQRKLSAATKHSNYSNGITLAPVDDIFDLLSAYSYRPIIEDEFNYQKDGKSAFRLATWNLHKLCSEKANNPGFREVFCRTLLENKISILGIQEVLDEQALKILCDELNTPTLRRICEWKENTRQWQYYLSPDDGQMAFLYDMECGNSKIKISQIGNSNDEDDSEESDFIIPPNQHLNYTIVEFKIDDLHFVLLNIHLIKENTDYQTALLCEMVDKLLVAKDRVIVLGDFYSSKNIGDLASCYKSVIDLECSTAVETAGALNITGRSGILVPAGERSKYADGSGIVRSGLSHLAIPRGWTWGGPASLHCPIWAEFYAC